MTLHVLHAGIGHPSPFFYNFLPAFEKYQDIVINVSPELPTDKTEKGIIYFHRLKRYYDSNDISSVNLFLKKVDNLKKNGWKIIWTIHNFFPIDRKITLVDDYLIKEFLSRVDIVFTFTDYMKNQLLEHYQRESIVHSIGTNNLDGWFDKNEFTIEFPENSFVFTFVGNITKYKMLDHIIETFKKFGKENCYLLIAGTFSRDNTLSFKDLPKNIVFYENFVGNKDWQKIAQITNVFINIYDLNLENFRFGFFPSNCIQLLKMKKISISPRSIIFSEIMPENSVIKYDFDDPKGLEKAMQIAIENKNNIKNAEKNIMSKKYNWSTTAEIIVKEIRGLFNEGKN